MFFIEDEDCPICLTGGRGFLLGSDHKTIVIMCDECEAMWLDPRNLDVAEIVDVEPPEFLLPDGSCSVAMPKARWATREEIDAIGWGHLIGSEGKGAGEGEFRLERQ